VPKILSGDVRNVKSNECVKRAKMEFKIMDRRFLK